LHQLVVDDVTMTFRVKNAAVAALQNVSLGLSRGEFGALIGPSGCGKSTLLRLIADIVQPTSGSLAIDGLPPAQARMDRRIGFVFQNPTLLPWCTVLDNVRLPLRIAGRSRAANSRRTPQKLIELVALAGFEQALPDQLSVGMQQRVAIARALVLEPQLLLLDEPFGALDEITRQRMNIELLRIWAEAKTTALLVTHSIAEAVFMADRVFVMTSRPGRIAAEFPVALSRPRSLEMMKTGEFFDIVNRIRDRLFVPSVQEHDPEKL
jgi:NitT/TauT family transport system ATP-binding protein